MKENLHYLLKKIVKTGNFKILLALFSGPKRWRDLEKIIVDKKTLSYGLDELIEAKLIKPTLLEDSPKGTKAYTLTDFGKFVLKKLDEIEEYIEKIEQVYKEGVSEDEKLLETYIACREEKSDVSSITLSEVISNYIREKALAEGFALKELRDEDETKEANTRKDNKQKKNKEDQE